MFSLLLGLHCSHFQLCHICVSLAFSFVFNNSNQATDRWRISKFFAYRTSWAAFTGYFIFHPSGTSTLVTSVQRIDKFLLPLLLLLIILIMILIIMIMNLPLNPLNPLCLVPDNFGPVSCSTLIPLWIWCLGPIFVLPWSELLCCSLSRPFLATGRISWYQPFPLSVNGTAHKGMGHWFMTVPPPVPLQRLSSAAWGAAHLHVFHSGLCPRHLLILALPLSISYW